MNEIAIVGLGGYGVNVTNYIKEKNEIENEIIVISSDESIKSRSKSDRFISLGYEPIRLNEEVSSLINNVDTIILLTGLGGEEGSDIALSLIELAKSSEVNVVSLITMPFAWEGKTRGEFAQQQLKVIEEIADSVGVIENDWLKNYLASQSKKWNMTEVLELVDNTYYEVIKKVNSLKSFDKEMVNKIIENEVEKFQSVEI